MSRVTHKLRIFAAAVAVGGLTVLGLASAAQASEAGSPLLTGVCVANLGQCHGKPSAQGND